MRKSRFIASVVQTAAAAPPPSLRSLRQRRKTTAPQPAPLHAKTQRQP